MRRAHYGHPEHYWDHYRWLHCRRPRPLDFSRHGSAWILAHRRARYWRLGGRRCDQRPHLEVARRKIPPRWLVPVHRRRAASSLGLHQLHGLKSKPRRLDPQKLRSPRPKARSAFRAIIDLTQQQNPMDTEGLEFIELTVPDSVPLAGFLGRIGFSAVERRVGRHRRRRTKAWSPDGQPV